MVNPPLDRATTSAFAWSEREPSEGSELRSDLPQVTFSQDSSGCRVEAEWGAERGSRGSDSEDRTKICRWVEGGVREKRQTVDPEV